MQSSCQLKQDIQSFYLEHHGLQSSSLGNSMKMVITKLEQTIHLQFYPQYIGAYQQEKSSERLKRIAWYAKEWKQS